MGSHTNTKKEKGDDKMTERDNERIIREIVNAINRQDLDALLDHLADDMMAFLSGFDETVDKEGTRKS